MLMARGLGLPYLDYSMGCLDDSELIGIEAKDAPISKLLYAIVAQAKDDGAKAITFSHENSQFRVFCWMECEGLEPAGEMKEIMAGPGNLLRPLLCHALWVLNHQDPLFASVRGTTLYHQPDEVPARWRIDAPDCRCWLRNPKDYLSLVIQIL